VRENLENQFSIPTRTPPLQGDGSFAPYSLVGKAGWFHTTGEKNKPSFQSLSPRGGEVWRGVKISTTKRKIKTYRFFFFCMKPPCYSLVGKGVGGLGFYTDIPHILNLYRFGE